MSLVECRDRVCLDSRGKRDERAIGQADAKVGVSIGDLDALHRRRAPPFDRIGAGSYISAKCSLRRPAGARSREMIGLREDERSGHELFAHGLVPPNGITVAVVSSIEEGVQKRRVNDDQR